LQDGDEGERIVQLDYLRELSMGDVEFEQTIIRQFIIQVPEELSSLHEAIQDQNMQQIKSIAHGMKSSVAYLGLNDRLHPVLHRMEVEAVSGIDNPHFEQDYDELKRVCERAMSEARELVQEMA
jgi:HPt (histidine-containing phosphotransfer) domain-containing protein